MQFKKACSASCVWHSDRPVPAFSGWMSALFYFSSHALSNIATNPDLGDVKKAFYKSRLELLCIYQRRGSNKRVTWKFFTIFQIICYALVCEAFN